LARECVVSLLKQTLDHSKYEVILVDNNSTPDIQKKLAAMAKELVLTYVFEPNQGLSHARNAGAKAAQGEYVAYIDDDAVASPDWLHQILAGFLQVQPVPTVVGGPYTALWQIPCPKWYNKRVELSFGNTSRFLTPAEARTGFNGTNVAFEKEMLFAVGGFPVELGYSGDQLISGEETQVFRKLMESNALFWYQVDAMVQHRVLKEKLRFSYALRNAFAGGRTTTLMRRSSHKQMISSSALLLCKSLYRTAREMILLLVNLLRFQKNWQVNLANQVFNLAKIWGEVYQLFV
jgi:glycosyltransferase involved in cell wall biosynthesis